MYIYLCIHIHQSSSVHRISKRRLQHSLVVDGSGGIFHRGAWSDHVCVLA